MLLRGIDPEAIGSHGPLAKQVDDSKASMAQIKILGCRND